MLFINTIKREGPRCTARREVDYIVKTGSAEKILKGVTSNLSLNGLCLYVFAPLKKGQKIKIVGGLRAKNTGVVCWNQKTDTNLYKVGIKFASGDTYSHKPKDRIDYVIV